MALSREDTTDTKKAYKVLICFSYTLKPLFGKGCLPLKNSGFSLVGNGRTKGFKTVLLPAVKPITFGE